MLLLLVSQVLSAFAVVSDYRRQDILLSNAMGNASQMLLAELQVADVSCWPKYLQSQVLPTCLVVDVLSVASI